MASEPTSVFGVPDMSMETVRICLSGHVQGVGFRPFVYRIARQNGLTGQVQNQMGQVEVIASGSPRALGRFQDELISNAPPLSRPTIDSIVPVESSGFSEFSIVDSLPTVSAKIFVPPDFFMCDGCRHELEDPADRRYRYPFINCTQCGPRYTLINRLPYDRPNTSMKDFPLCRDCRDEYQDPGDRRFHAEPVACPACGPQLLFRVSGKGHVRTKDAALTAAIKYLRSGKIVAVKGIGGYHLVCDAHNRIAVDRLRVRKRRPDKPLAVMFPIAGEDELAFVARSVDLTDAEADMLRGPMRPIVLATKRRDFALADNLAPGLRELGVFLPYSPLHQLLLTEFAAPLVATSGNISGEPVLTEAPDVEARLSRVADAFLHHDRPIVRPADDSVYRRIAGAARPLRIGRGAAPREMFLPWRQEQPVLAVGGHMKGTVTLAWDNRAVVSPHIGEMDSPRSMAVFERVADDLQALYGVQAQRIVCDAHPGYATTRWARQQASLPVTRVWHHRAHASAVAAELDCAGQWLVFTWDGVGLGEDGTLWGGEALLGQAGSWNRVCSMRSFRPPGGDRAGREPWRSAAAIHWAAGQAWPDCPDADGIAYAAWQQQLNAPETTAVGRLFDAASALICGTHTTSFEAQGPMLLESLCEGEGEVTPLPLGKGADGILRSDWAPLLAMMVDDRRAAAERAAAFHASMADALRAQARRVRESHQVDQVGLAGGVFQNRVLTDQVVKLLQADGFTVHLNRLLPCNDAALSFGQAAECAARDGLKEV